MLAPSLRPRENAVARKMLALNWPFLLLTAAIVLVGIAALYSIGGGSFEPWAGRHLVRYCIALALAFVVALVDMKFWLRTAYPMYVLALALLIAVPLIGYEGGGARRWLGYGEYVFQPAELMKVALVMALARYYQWLPARRVSNPLALVLPMLLIAAPVLLVLKQPDLGTAAVLAAIGGGIMFLAGISLIYFLITAGLCIWALPHVWESLHDYQRERILTFFDPDRDPLGAGYHILQSKIALGSGGLLGKGFMHGTQSHLNFLPEKHTDFIFTMFTEEMGFIGAVALLTLYLLILLCIAYMALRCRNPFGRLMAAGVGIMLFVYVFANIAMVMGLVPVVGVPLPLVSYGGTAMLTLMFGFGLVLNAHLNRRTEFYRSEIGFF